jgi:uncharacterized protein (DUF1015 family)
MAKIFPFKGVRPTKDKVHLVVSRSVETYSKTEINAKMISNPYSFLHIIKEVPNVAKQKNSNKEQLVQIKKKYKHFLKENIFKIDEKECYYLYEQVKDGISYTGIIGIISIDDYLEGNVKIHEQTITERETKLMEYLEICNFNAEPVCFLFPDNVGIDSIIKETRKQNPEYFFTTADKVTHILWLIQEESALENLKDHFQSIPSVYIADGHHRSASSALLGQFRRKQKPNFSGDEGFNYYMGIFFPESSLRIFDFNRVVKDLNNMTADTLLNKLKSNFEVTPMSQENFSPAAIHEMSMYLEGRFYRLKALKHLYTNVGITDGLDAHILTKHILQPLFEITDLKTDKRVSFIPGIKGSVALKNAVDSGKFAVAFGLYPVAMKQLKEIADTGNIMPPKTTWVEPQLRSGLVIYDMELKGN